MVVFGRMPDPVIASPAARTPALGVRPETVLEPADSSAAVLVWVAASDSSRLPVPSVDDGGAGGNAGSADFLANGELPRFSGEASNFFSAGRQISLAGRCTQVASSGGRGRLAVKAKCEVPAGRARNGQALDRARRGGGVKWPLFCVFELTFCNFAAAIGVYIAFSVPEVAVGLVTGL